MRYQGGKCRIAKEILQVIEQYRTTEDTFIDLFVSEQAAPPDFKRVWAKTVKRSLGNNHLGQPEATEGLYMLS